MRIFAKKFAKLHLFSPTSKSSRPWEFIVVTEEDLLEKLSDSKKGAQLLKGAPLGIVILGDPSKSDVWIEDTSIASIDIQLTAESMGLGSCWVQIRNRMRSPEESSEDYIKTILDIPKSIRVESIIVIGHPDEIKKPYTDEHLILEKVHNNKFGSKYNL